MDDLKAIRALEAVTDRKSRLSGLIEHLERTNNPALRSTLQDIMRPALAEFEAAALAGQDVCLHVGKMWIAITMVRIWICRDFNACITIHREDTFLYSKNAF